MVSVRETFREMSFVDDKLATRTFLQFGKWSWQVIDTASGAVLTAGETHGGEGEAHLRAVHAADMLRVADEDETLDSDMSNSV